MYGIDYNIKRSRRKTLGIYIKGASVEVRAPLRMPAREIKAFVVSKADWIEKHLMAQRERERLRGEFKLREGTPLLYRGAEYPLRLAPARQAGFNGEFFYAPRDLEQFSLREALTDVYKRLARNYLKQRTAEIAHELALAPSAVKVNSAKTRWGSCSGKNSVNLSWRLIMAGDDCIDYVIVHELAHIAEHNHSRRFWSIVESALPGYKRQRSKLKLLAERLLAEGW